MQITKRIGLSILLSALMGVSSCAADDKKQPSEGEELKTASEKDPIIVQNIEIKKPKAVTAPQERRSDPETVKVRDVTKEKPKPVSGGNIPETVIVSPNYGPQQTPIVKPSEVQTVPVKTDDPVSVKTPASRWNTKDPRPVIKSRSGSQQPLPTPSDFPTVDLLNRYDFDNIQFRGAEDVAQQLLSASEPKSGESLSGAFNLEGPIKLEEIRNTKLKNGTIVTRYRQLFHGLPIAGGDVTVSQLQNDKSSFSGELIWAFPGALSNHKAFSSELMARLETLNPDYRAKAFEAFNSKYKVEANEANTGREKYSHYLRKTEKGLALTTSVSFIYKDENGFQNPKVTMDTNTGEMISIENKARRSGFQAKGVGGNPNSGKYFFMPVTFDPQNPTFPGMEISKQGTECYLKNNDVKTSDARTTNGLTDIDDIFDAPAVIVDCSGIIGDEAFPVNEAFSPLNDAHAFSTMMIKMFERVYPDLFFSQTSYPELHVVGLNGKGNNAEYIENTIFLESGIIGETYPMAVPDIIAHEMGHWFTDIWRSDFTLIGGGSMQITSEDFKSVEESYADMMGVVFEDYLNRNFDYGSINVQKIGDMIYPSGLNYVRDICNPRRVTHVSHATPGVRVHEKVGLFNKVFCELSRNYNGNYEKAFEVFTQANVFHWQSNDDFYTAAEGVELAAVDLGYTTQEIYSAFAVVGICLSNGTSCSSDPVDPPLFQTRTYTLTERIMITESSDLACSLNDNVCFEEACPSTFPGSSFEKMGCFKNANEFLCAVECQSKVNL